MHWKRVRHWLTALLLRLLRPKRRPTCFGRRKALSAQASTHFNTPKPQWVRKEIIRLRAMMPEGCRTLADYFNRCYGAKRQITVGKTFVNDVIRQHQYEIHALREKLRHAAPKPAAPNQIWGMDMMGKTDKCGKQHAILGM